MSFVHLRSVDQQPPLPPQRYVIETHVMPAKRKSRSASADDIFRTAVATLHRRRETVAPLHVVVKRSSVDLVGGGAGHAVVDLPGRLLILRFLRPARGWPYHLPYLPLLPLPIPPPTAAHSWRQGGVHSCRQDPLAEQTSVKRCMFPLASATRRCPLRAAQQVLCAARVSQGTTASISRSAT